jgi:retinol dehydrogenase-14
MENPGSSIDIGEFDLADCDSIRNFSKGLLDEERRIDILCNNAGVMACPMMRTKDGFEMQLGVNHLGHFLLTNMLIPLLQKTASETNDVRIINVASAAHIPGRIDFDDLQYERREYKRWEAYSQSKLANVMFSYELAKRLGSTCISSDALHPGVVATELGRYLFPSLSSSDESASPFWAAPLLFVLKQFLLTPEQGARTSIYLASDDAVRGVTGKYFDSCKPVESNRESYDNTISAKLWDVSAELVKLD